MDVINARIGRYLIPTLGSLALLAASTAQATVVSGSAAGTGLSVDVNGLVNISTNLGTANVASPAPASDSGQFVDLDVGTNIGLVNASAEADVINGSASSTVDGNSGSKSASGAASIVNLDVGAAALGAVPLLSLTSDTISSNASVTGDYNNFMASGGSTLENASLNILGNTIDLDALLGTGPNSNVTVNTGLAGVSLTLNEQDVTGDGVNNRGITVSALHLALNNFGGGNFLSGVLNGDIFLGRSQASLSAVPNEAGVPAPSILLLLGSGLAGIGLIKRRKILKG